jgi:hypothetical protein
MRTFSRVITSIICLAFLHPASAQEATEAKILHHQIGVSTLGLLNLIRDDAEGSEFQTPILFSYAYRTPALIVRVGIGPKYSSESIERDGFTDREEISSLAIDGRIGAGIRFIADGRWEAYAGVDAAGGYHRDRTIEDTGFDRITEQTELRRAGGGPFLQVDYHLSPVVSLGAESGLYWIQETTKRTVHFENFPDFDSEISETTGNDLDVSLPNTIFLRFHF